MCRDCVKIYNCARVTCLPSSVRTNFLPGAVQRKQSARPIGSFFNSPLWRKTLGGPFRQYLHQARTGLAKVVPPRAAGSHEMVGTLDKFDPLVAGARLLKLGANIR